jgi:hypothetical protein
MKLTTTLATLLVTALAPLATSSFGAILDPVNKVGTVTVNLTLTTEEGGFDGDYEKDVSDTKSLYKSVVKAQKYSTKEFITDLISRYELSGSSSDYSMKYVESNQYEFREFRGYFLVNKDLTTVIYIGGYDADGNASLPFDTYNPESYANRFDLSFETGSSTYTRKVSGTTTKYTNKGSENTTSCGMYLYFSPLGADEYFETFCVVKSGSSYQSTSTYEGEELTDQTEKYSVSPTTFTNIVGSNYDGVMLTGSYTISALKDTADVSAYRTAYNNYFN